MLGKLAFIVSGVALLALACGPAGSQAPGGGSGDGGPKYGGTLSYRIPNDLFDYDLSYQGKTTPNNKAQTLVHSSLVGFKFGPEVEYNELVLRPELAERWEVSPDARTVTYYLRTGVRFHDIPPVNGRELTSADVKWSYEYWSRTGEFKDKKLPQGQFDYMFDGLDRIETPDSHTVKVHFKEAFVPFLAHSGNDFNPIVAREVFDQDGHLKDRMIGAGYFQLDPAASQKGTRWVFKKHPSYFGDGRPYLDGIRMLVIPDDAATIAAFQTGQTDILTQEVFSYQSLQDFNKGNPKAVIYEYTAEGARHIYMNTAKPPLDDLRVRKAIALAIDRDQLSKLETGGKSAWAPAGALNGMFSDAEARQVLKHDPAEARTVLRDAGYAPGSVSLLWDYPGNDYGEEYISTIQLIQAQLKDVGISVDLKSVDKVDFSAGKKNRTLMVNLGNGFCGDKGDPDASMWACYHSKAKGNYGNIKDSELDNLLDAQRREPNPEKRRELWRSAVKRINENFYAIDLYYPPQWQAYHPYVQGFRPNAGSEHEPFESTWLDR